MSKKSVARGIVLCAVALSAVVWWLGRVAGLQLAGQQDALREQWIAGNAAVGGKYAYLTFDDGPSDNTDAILDILKEKGVKATFFVVGKEGEQARKRYLRILAEGHTLGMHSYSHDYEEIYRSVEYFAKDIRKLDRHLYEITGKHPQVFRFPGGSSNSIVGDIRPYIEWIREQGYEYYDWNAASDDAVQIQLPASVLNQNILKDVHGQETVIVLMHDLAETVHTTESLPDLIDALREQGYELRAITPSTPPIHHVSAEE